MSKQADTLNMRMSLFRLAKTPHAPTESNSSSPKSLPLKATYDTCRGYSYHDKFRLLYRIMVEMPLAGIMVAVDMISAPYYFNHGWR